jgi:hypothetical protein
MHSTPTPVTLDIPALGLQLDDEVQWRKEFVAWNASLPMPDTQLEPMQLAVVVGMRLRRNGIGDEAVNARTNAMAKDLEHCGE